MLGHVSCLKIVMENLRFVIVMSKLGIAGVERVAFHIQSERSTTEPLIPCLQTMLIKSKKIAMYYG